MEKTYKVEFTEKQLSRVLEMMQAAPRMEQDEHLLGWLAWKLKYGYQVVSGIQPSEINLDEIPF